VATSRAGAAAKAGHDLLIDVTSWEATLVVGRQSSIVFAADGGSLRVREGTGGIKPLGEDDKKAIDGTIDGILEKRPIEFRSTEVHVDGTVIRARGEAVVRGIAQPIEVEVSAVDGGLSAAVVLRQTDFGIKPYSALFGALQVADEVTVAFGATLPA
jgi:hypothetical protein